MADYECFPIWVAMGNFLDNVPTAAIGVSAPLAAEIDAWMAAFDSTYNRSDPASSGFSDAQSTEHFYASGLALAGRIALELGDTAEVSYYDGRSNVAYRV